mmetsp:Transcript_74/g.287  ORF Transcript_74/g.287 Transcript_74/m.287 type:complete len:274 (-) Transcript_74:112-933(-)
MTAPWHASDVRPPSLPSVRAKSFTDSMVSLTNAVSASSRARAATTASAGSELWPFRGPRRASRPARASASDTSAHRSVDSSAASAGGGSPSGNRPRTDQNSASFASRSTVSASAFTRRWASVRSLLMSGSVDRGSSPASKRIASPQPAMASRPEAEERRVRRTTTPRRPLVICLVMSAQHAAWSAKPCRLNSSPCPSTVLRAASQRASQHSCTSRRRRTSASTSAETAALAAAVAPSAPAGSQASLTCARASSSLAAERSAASGPTRMASRLS